jgi:hypothetical protein
MTRAKRHAYGRALCQCYLAITSSLAYLADPVVWGRGIMTQKEREYLNKVLEKINQDAIKLREFGNRLEDASK